MGIEDWKRPSHWQEYPGMDEQIWKIKQLRELCLYLRENLKCEFVIFFEDETCIYVNVKEEGQLGSRP